MQQNQQALQTIQEKAMERIRELHEEEKKEVERAVSAKLKQLRTDDEELDRFVGALRRRLSFEEPWDAPLEGGPEGM
jgi:hypothetical protein